VIVMKRSPGARPCPDHLSAVVRSPSRGAVPDGDVVRVPALQPMDLVMHHAARGMVARHSHVVMIYVLGACDAACDGKQRAQPAQGYHSL
jgi:hypothetical protein